MASQGRHYKRRKALGRAFSLVELVIVVVILGTITAIAVPRMVSASANATANALNATVANVRMAVDTYYAEHGQYPGYNPGTGSPEGVSFVKQLLSYSDEAGNTSSTPSGVYRFGPYLRKPFPTNPFSELQTVHVKKNPAAVNPADGSVGWVAVLSHGYFGILATDAELAKVQIDDAAKRELLRAK